MDKIDEIREDIEQYQENQKKEMLLDSVLEKMHEEQKEARMSNAKVILSLAIAVSGVIFGVFCGVLGFIQILKWIISVIKAIF